MDLAVFGEESRNWWFILKNNEWEGKDAEWGKRLATAAIFNSFLSETSVFKMGGKNDKLFLKTLFQKNKVPNGESVWHEHIYYYSSWEEWKVI